MQHGPSQDSTPCPCYRAEKDDENDDVATVDTSSSDRALQLSTPLSEQPFSGNISLPARFSKAPPLRKRLWQLGKLRMDLHLYLLRSWLKDILKTPQIVRSMRMSM
eukprot:3764426-Pyramimonas_sp.AAC.1